MQNQSYASGGKHRDGHTAPDTGNMGFRSIIQIHRSSSRWVGYGLRVPSIRQRSEALYGLSAVAGSRHKSEIITCTPAPMPS